MSVDSAAVPIPELVALVGAEYVIQERAEQIRFLRDFSWYSPLLTTTFADVPVDVIVRPGTMDELTAVVRIAARDRIPLTVRGAGTGNYGQSLPLHGGILADIRRLNRIVELTDDTIIVEPGIILGDAEEAARRRGREFRIVPSTYRRATAYGSRCTGSRVVAGPGEQLASRHSCERRGAEPRQSR